MVARATGDPLQSAIRLTVALAVSAACFVIATQGTEWGRVWEALRQADLSWVLAVMLGLASWLLMELVAPQALIPPQLVGLGLSFLGMVAGSLASRPAHPHPHHG